MMSCENMVKVRWANDRNVGQSGTAACVDREAIAAVRSKDLNASWSAELDIRSRDSRKRNAPTMADGQQARLRQSIGGEREFGRSSRVAGRVLGLCDIRKHDVAQPDAVPHP